MASFTPSMGWQCKGILGCREWVVQPITTRSVVGSFLPFGWDVNSHTFKWARSVALAYPNSTGTRWAKRKAEQPCCPIWQREEDAIGHIASDRLSAPRRIWWRKLFASGWCHSCPGVNEGPWRGRTHPICPSWICGTRKGSFCKFGDWKTFVLKYLGGIPCNVATDVIVTKYICICSGDEENIYYLSRLKTNIRSGWSGPPSLPTSFSL